MLNKKSKKAMKNQSENLMAACAAYVAPAVEVLEVSVEKGFAQSLDGAEGDSGDLIGTIGNSGNW
jgi:hypothetical protein